MSGGREPKTLIALIKSMRPGSIIYTVELSRLTRMGIEETFKIRRLAIEAGIQIITDKGSLAEYNTLLLAVEAWTAEQERETISRRMNRWHARRREQGLASPARIAIKKGTWKSPSRPPNPLWAKALPRLIEMQASGMTISEITKAASKEFKHTFSRSQVGYLLKKAKDEHEQQTVSMRDRDAQLDAMGGVNPR